MELNRHRMCHEDYTCECHTLKKEAWEEALNIGPSDVRKTVSVQKLRTLIASERAEAEQRGRVEAVTGCLRLVAEYGGSTFDETREKIRGLARNPSNEGGKEDNK